jgi:hypothetical protein
MATAKKPNELHGNSRAAKMRKYYIAHPNAKPAEVAKEFNTSYQIAYMVKRKMQAKKIVVTATEVAMAKRLGVSAVDYAKQKAQIIGKAKQETKLVDAHTEIFDFVNQPPHYKVGGIETIDFIEAKNLDYNLGNAVKYISRAQFKGKFKEDLEKAKWYLSRAISQIKE